MGNEIENISDQIDGYAEDIINKAKRSAERYDISFESTLNAYSIAAQNIKCDVLWRRIREMNESLQVLTDVLHSQGVDYDGD